MKGRGAVCAAAFAACVTCAVPASALAAPSKGSLASGVGNLPQGTQGDTSFAASYAAARVRTIDVTAQQVSCYRPEVPYPVVGAGEGYSGESACPGATTGEDTGAAGPYPSQSGSNPGYPASAAMLVKDHSESDIRVDPTNRRHLIGTSKWVVSPEGYNHLLGFFESFDGGSTWPVQGHIPGYEGWTDNTDPVGTFDPWGNFYVLALPYEFFYDGDGGHDFHTNPNREPNPVVPAEVISVAVRPHGAAAATDWITTHRRRLDVIAGYDQIGNEPDKQWITADDNPQSPHYGRVYAMWVDYHSLTPVTLVSHADARPDGTHTDWSPPQRLPQGLDHPQGTSDLLPHVAPDGTVYTTLTNFEPEQGYCCVNLGLDVSRDGGATWTFVSRLARDVSAPPLHYANTTFRDGIENTFAVGDVRVNGSYPLYVSWEDYSAGVVNTILSASYDGGHSWTPPIQVNDNARAVDEFQPNLATASDGTVSVAFYDRRLDCPAAGTAEAHAAGLQLDTVNPYARSLPPYSASNYCVNAAIQFYSAALAPLGHNIRLSAHTWDPELNAPRPYGIGSAIGFIGDYFGNSAAGAVEVTTSVSTYDDGRNPLNRQQQVVAEVAIP
jgi:hypothetical protein